MMKLKLIPAALTLMVATAAIAANLQAIKIAWTPKAEQSLEYKLTAKGKLTEPIEGEFTYAAKVMMKVEKIEDGKITMSSTQGAPEITFNGMPIDASMTGMGEVKSTTVLNAKGELLESTTTPAEASNPRMEGLSSFIYPEADVKIGDTWTHKRAADSAKGTFEINYTFKYVADEKIGNYDTRKVEMVVKESGAEINMEMTGTMWVDVTDGNLVKMEGKGKNIPMAPGMPPLDMEMGMERTN